MTSQQRDYSGITIPERGGGSRHAAGGRRTRKASLAGCLSLLEILV